MPQKEYFLELPSDPENLPKIEEFVMEIAEKTNLIKDKYNNLALSVAEASSNSIMHGNKSDISKLIKIHVVVDDVKMRISFKDEGRGFDIKEVPDPTAPENILKDSGRGIHIMKSFLEDLSYIFTDEGTETLLVINLK